MTAQTPVSQKIASIGLGSMGYGSAQSALSAGHIVWGVDAVADSAMRAVNQLLAGVHIATMAEASTFDMIQRVALEKFVEVISQCAGSSWMLENRAPITAADMGHGQEDDAAVAKVYARNAGLTLPNKG